MVAPLIPNQRDPLEVFLEMSYGVSWIWVDHRVPNVVRHVQLPLKQLRYFQNEFSGATHLG